MRSRRRAPNPRHDENDRGESQMQSTNWTREHCDALRECRGNGMSFAEIAEAINAKFKTDYSRNAAHNLVRLD